MAPDDIVPLLRAMRHRPGSDFHTLMAEAADEIDRLRAALREVEGEIKYAHLQTPDFVFSVINGLVNRALNPKPPEVEAE